MQIDISVLESIGLTNSQIKVYLNLLELGEAKTGEIIKHTRLQSSVVYNALNQLIQNGLASFILKGQVKHFFATDPENLLKFIDDKKEGIKMILPQLLAKKTLTNKNQEAQIFLGWRGIYFAFNKILDILPKGSEYIAFGAGFEEQYSEEAKKFFKEYQKKRAELKYKVKIIVNESSRKQVEAYEWYPKFGKPQYKYVPGFAPIGLIIFKDNILHVAFGEDPIAVIITSLQIADSFKNMFYNMWKIAKK
ncbi:MAG: TrmB family transcriptional regulator [Nanoarchaeota archaeon]